MISNWLFKEQKHSFVWYHSYKVQTFNIKFVLTKRVTNKQLSTIYVLQKMIIPKTVKVTCFVLCLNVISLALYLTFNPCNLPKTQIQSPFKMSCNFKHKNVYDLQYKIYPKLLPISLWIILHKFSWKYMSAFQKWMIIKNLIVSILK